MRQTIFTIAIAIIFQVNLQAQTINDNFFDEVNSFMAEEVKNGALDYASLKNNSQLDVLIKTVSNADLTNASDQTKKAFYINAYNLHVIKSAANAYPLESVQEVIGFFDRKKMTVAGIEITLNDLEKKKLIAPYKDGRLHFALVCGALGCPPITNFAYRPEMLDEQLDQQTKIALNNPSFIQTTNNKVKLSQIFKWYESDFGKNKAGVIKYINKYRSTPINSSAKVSYYPYDWALNDISNTTSSINDGGNNSARYIVSSTIPKGSSEIKIFNNLYTQRTGFNEGPGNRSTFFTTSISALYGLTNKLNVGFSTRYRRVRNDILDSSPFEVLGGQGTALSTRQGVTAFGPQIRFAPKEEWTNFSIQSAFVFAIGNDLAGSSTQPYIDWTGPTWNTQFFNDFSIGRNFSLFTEIDLLIEDIGFSADHINRISTPITTIFSYNPSPKATLYALQGFSPYWQADFDYFYQVGLGTKYQFAPNFELELLVTKFANRFLIENEGDAATFNLGLRFNL